MQSNEPFRKSFVIPELNGDPEITAMYAIKQVLDELTPQQKIPLLRYFYQRCKHELLEAGAAGEG